MDLSNKEELDLEAIEKINTQNEDDRINSFLNKKERKRSNESTDSNDHISNFEISESSSEKERRICTTEHKVGTIEEAEDYMKGNEYILRGYRIQFDSARKIIKRYYFYLFNLKLAYLLCIMNQLMSGLIF